MRLSLSLNAQGLSPLFIGATIVSFGTSVPELFASVNANLQGYPGISLGNVSGLKRGQYPMLVLGATAFVFQVTADPKHLIKDIAMMLFATAIMTYGILTDNFSQVFGLIMFAILATFVYLPIQDRQHCAGR